LPSGSILPQVSYRFVEGPDRTCGAPRDQEKKRPWPILVRQRKPSGAIARRTAINTNRRSRVRSFIRKVEEAIASGDQAAAADALKAAQPEVMRGAQKGILHKNTASRKVSRLAKRIKALSA
jgi:small subunit ribosomal protein S20